MERTFYPKEIQLFFNEIIERINEVLDPDFILLAGSFGKESWLYLNDELISDFELVFVCKKRWSLKKKTELLRDLNIEYPYDISLKGFLLKNVLNKVVSNYASKNPGYLSLDFYDTFSNPVFLYSKNSDIFQIDCKVDEIPVWEGWRLYVNRMGDLLKLESSLGHDQQLIEYYWLKIFESTADVYCIINNIYNKDIGKRLQIFNKELIDNDKELNRICKRSWAIIRQALEARKNHNLMLFENTLSIDERKNIVMSWMGYFEKKLAQQEKMVINRVSNFHYNYLNNKTLQRKYLGFDNNFNIILSNSIKLIYNPKFLNRNFKFYNNNYSWRHIILLCVSSIFYEQNIDNYNFSESKKIAFKLLNQKEIKKLNNDEFMRMILIYWKKLR